MESIDRRLAAEMLKIQAVLLRPEEPFVWASGWHAPIYCDNRKILSCPELRSSVAGWLADKARETCPGAEIVAGVATGAIAHGVLVAERLGKPFIYVRPKPKNHGTGSRIEGILPRGAKVVVIEDMVSTGMSSLSGVRALREAGAEVLGMVAIFTYDFDLAASRFDEAGVPLTALSNYGALVEEALAAGSIQSHAYEVLQEWRRNPDTYDRDNQ